MTDSMTGKKTDRQTSRSTDSLIIVVVVGNKNQQYWQTI